MIRERAKREDSGQGGSRGGETAVRERVERAVRKRERERAVSEGVETVS